MKALPRWAEQGIALALVVACLWGWLHAERVRAAESSDAALQLRSANRRAAAWQSFYAHDAQKVETVTVTVLKRAAHTDTLRDTLLAHVTDTILVKQYVHAADSTIRACRDLVNDCAHFRVVADSTIRAVEAQRDAWQAKDRADRPRWYDRVGIGLGVGALRDGTTVRAGPVVALTLRVWP